MREILMVGIGGFAGSVLRYAVSLLVPLTGVRTAFPVSTFSVNVIGSLLIGLVVGRLAGNVSHVHYLAVVGFCGGFTTFSAFSLEVVKLMRAGQLWLAVTYVAISVVLCVAATALGFYLTTRN